MERIGTQDDLIIWLYDRILASESQIKVTPGLVRLGHVIRDEVLDVGYLARYDCDCWHGTFDSILRLVAKPGVTRCGARLISFLAAAYSEVAASDGESLPIDRLNQLMILVLGYEGSYLNIGANGRVELLRSTRRCEREFGVKIGVVL